jgi:peptidoglycan L-alanyl-D-glutamate endopeptidase CwlK
MFKFSSRSEMRLEGVHPKIIEVLRIGLTRSPIDFGIAEYGGLRTVEDQQFLFNDGGSKCDGIRKKSKHQRQKSGYGEAFDVYAYLNRAASFDKIHLAIIAGVILAVAKEKGVKCVWGGTFNSNEFKGWDFGHFEFYFD